MSRNRNARVFFKSDRGFILVMIVEDDGHTRLGNSCLATLVDKILQVLCSHSRHVRNTQNETDGIEDVGLATAVQTSDRVEGFVPMYKVSRCAAGCWRNQSQAAGRIEAEQESTVGHNERIPS